MNFFFDTNIIIGYIFYFDKWNREAKKLFKEENIYWSETVKNEVINKIIEKLNEFKTFIMEIIKKLKKETVPREYFISLVNQPKIPNKNNKKYILNRSKIAKLLWKKAKWDEEVEKEKLINFLWKSIDETFDETYINLTNCKRKLRLHIRKKEYKKLLKKINSLKISNKRIHKPDNLILLDAHDLASNNIKINFITADKRLLEFKKFIKKITEITEMTFIKISIIYKTIEGYNRKIRTCQT